MLAICRLKSLLTVSLCTVFLLFVSAVSSGFKPSLKLGKLYCDLIVINVNLQCNKVKINLIWLVYVLNKLVCLSDRFVWRKWRTSSLRWLSLVFTRLITKVPTPVRVSYTRRFSAATEMEVVSPVPNCTWPVLEEHCVLDHEGLHQSPGHTAGADLQRGWWEPW